LGAGGGRKVEEGLENGVGKAWESRWKMTEKEVLAEAGASFFGGCWKMRERGDFVVISDLGIHLDIQFGNSPLKVWEFKKWK
jgi:hypothetical protein